eukprot:4810124-Pyramimonas_sp.AAC.2
MPNLPPARTVLLVTAQERGCHRFIHKGGSRSRKCFGSHVDCVTVDGGILSTVHPPFTSQYTSCGHLPPRPHILPSLLRLVPDPDMSSRPSSDWFPPQ